MRWEAGHCRPEATFGLTAAVAAFFTTQGKLMAAYGIEDKDKG